jgi:hypothetical protein
VTLAVQQHYHQVDLQQDKKAEQALLPSRVVLEPCTPGLHQALHVTCV